MTTIPGSRARRESAPESWRMFRAVGAAVSLARSLLFFERGLFISVAIDVAILAVVAWTYRSKERQPTLKAVSSA